MKIRKFKLIKEYPGSGELGKVLTNECEGIENWSEYWEEIKEEPILITEDGKELFEGDEYWFIDEEFIAYPNIVEDGCGGKKDYKYFSTKESAKKWIEENKPKWSNKDMIEFAEKWEYDKHLLSSDIKKALKTKEYAKKEKTD
jgi:hypothetical protein